MHFSQHVAMLMLAAASNAAPDQLDKRAANKCTPCQTYCGKYLKNQGSGSNQKLGTCFFDLLSSLESHTQMPRQVGTTIRSLPRWTTLRPAASISEVEEGLSITQSSCARAEARAGTRITGWIGSGTALQAVTLILGVMGMIAVVGESMNVR